jgi:phosphoribosyl-AMP cyclohydrolase
MTNNNNAWLDQIKWSEDGLVTAVIQDHRTQQVLMVAWMNREALTLTVAEQRAVYWSRSRKQLWRKGESSGHIQQLHDVRLDCDGDTLLLRVEQIGGIACHTGRYHCFYRQWQDGHWQTVDPIIKNPVDIYKDE